MKRIDTPSADDGHFTNSNPDAGGDPTQLDASWFENVQEELAHVVEESGQTLDGGNKTQLLAAIRTLVNRAGIAVPAGATIKMRGGSVPEGYVAEDGKLYYIDKCPGLYNAIGNTFNNGSVPINTFRVPNACGRVDVAAGTGAGLTERELGDTGGVETVTLTADQIPEHDHGVVLDGTSGIGDADGGDRHVMTSDNELYGGADPATYITTKPVGGNEAHDNMPPFIVALSCIKLGPTDNPEVYPE